MVATTAEVCRLDSAALVSSIRASVEAMLQCMWYGSYSTAVVCRLDSAALVSIIRASAEAMLPADKGRVTSSFTMSCKLKPVKYS